MACSDLRGKELWTYQPQSGHHVLDLRFSFEQDAFLAVEWPFERGGGKDLIRLSRSTGNKTFVGAIGKPTVTTFASAGGLLVTSDGRVVNTETGGTEDPFETWSSS